MQLKDYTEEINLQIDFLKKLKDNSSDDSLKSKIDTLISKIYDDIITKNDPAVKVLAQENEANTSSEKIKQDKLLSNAVLDSLSNEYGQDRKHARRFSYLNLFAIIFIISIFSFLINRAFNYTNDLVKPYLTSANTNNEFLDSLYEKNLQKQTSFLDRLKSLSSQDSITLKFLDSVKTLNAVEIAAGKLESRTSNFSKVQPLVYFHIFLIIAFIFAIIAVLVYLVKVFVNIHRYNHILADHYEALEGAFKTLKNKEIFADKFDLEKAYSLMHPQKEKFIEVNAPVNMDTESITKALSDGLLNKFSITSKQES